MKTTFLYICMSVVSIAGLSQQSHDDIFKVYSRRITTDCRTDTEEIFLYKDSSFKVYSCLGGVRIDYTGGWWINDSMLILQPSQNCNGPLLLDKKEYQDRKTEGVRIEVYNEKGKLLYFSIINDSSGNGELFNYGCNLLGIKERFLHRHLRFSVTGKGLAPITTKKKNNAIEIIILEPSSGSDIYIGKQVYPLKSLTEISLTTEKTTN